MLAMNQAVMKNSKIISAGFFDSAFKPFDEKMSELYILPLISFRSLAIMTLMVTVRTSLRENLASPLTSFTAT